MGRLVSLNVGPARTLLIGGRPVATAMAKRAVADERAVLALGIDGDEQADRAAHGGLGKAVYAYPAQHYAFWQTVRAQAQAAPWDETLPFGSLGENLTVEGLAESALWIGDVLRFAGCELAVSEPRLPCFKLDAALGFAHASKLMTESAWCGAYLAVRSPGTIAPGQAFTLVPGPREVGIVELFRARCRRAATA